MAISLEQMQREVVQFGLEEMRNRGLEDAARLVEWRAATLRGQSRWSAESDARAIRDLKKDPHVHLTDWWKKAYVCDFAPMGA